MKSLVFNELMRGVQPERLFVIDNSNMKLNEATMIATLQGLLARDSKEQIYILDEKVGRYDAYIKLMEEKYGTEVVNVQCPWQLIDRFKENIKCYIVYDDEKLTLNNANTMAGIFNGIAVERSLVEKVKAYNISEGDKVESNHPIWLMNKYKGLYNTDIIFEQRIGGHLNICLRDYISMTKSVVFILPPRSNDRSVVLKRIKPNGFVIGWGDAGALGSETPFIIETSLAGKCYIPMDNALNVSVLSSFDSKYTGGYKQKTNTTLPQHKKAHYVLFLMSDGDNVQWFINRFDNKQWWGSEHRGTIPVGWSIPPTALNLCPMILDWHYDTMSDNDGFVIAPSGNGFIFPSLYPREDLNLMLTDMNKAMGVLDVNSVAILGLNSFHNCELWEDYTKHENVDGVLYYDWYDFNLARKEGINIHNNTPVVDSAGKLFEMKRAHELADYLNNTTTDVNNQHAYTLVYVNNWDGVDRIKEIKEVMEMCNEYVVPVTPQQFIGLINKNINKIG